MGIVGPPESAKSLFAANIAACVATGKSFGDRSCRQGLVVYLWGEGQMGAARRLQAVDRHYQLGLQGSPFLLSKIASSLLDASETTRISSAIDSAEKQFGQRLALLIVDTLARFIAPGDESKAQDMTGFLAAVDSLRGSATAIICHHPGHTDHARARGSSGWKAALDAEYTLSKTGDVVTVTCQKMKDGEKPEPFALRIVPANTAMVHEDGSPVQSVVLIPADLETVSRSVTGKNQRKLLAELKRRTSVLEEAGVWTEEQLRKIARDLDMKRSSAKTAVKGLHDLACLVATTGGYRLADVHE